jgi:hypothetical protein
MLIEMTASALISFNALSAHGASTEAQFVAERANEARRHLYESNALGLQKREVFEELCAVTEECRTRNWDGYGADPVLDDAYQLAYRFLEALPPGTPAPSVGAEPDGHLTLEWYRSPHHTLSVSVSPEGDLHYAALVGPNKAYGTEAFFWDVPKAILDLIHRLHAA